MEEEIQVNQFPKCLNFQNHPKIIGEALLVHPNQVLTNYSRMTLSIIMKVEKQEERNQ